MLLIFHKLQQGELTRTQVTTMNQMNPPNATCWSNTKALEEGTSGRHSRGDGAGAEPRKGWTFPQVGQGGVEGRRRTE